ncbi:MAG: hypothetical protein AB8H80_08365 [Planctomycetota bacterium]
MRLLPCLMGLLAVPTGPACAQEPASPGPVAAPAQPDEARYVEILDVPLPDDVVLEVGGIVLREDTLFVATRRGEVWRIEGASSDSPKPTLWAEGLQEPLGLIERDGWLYCAQRGELSRMRDARGDGRMDELETVSSGWPLSGNYHEYCFGPTVAGDGSFWLTLNKPFGPQPFGKADWRGWAIRIPAAGGAFEPVCAGLRSPCGIGTAPDGVVWYTDNQGEWCANSKFAPLAVGDFHGHPHGIESCKLPASQVEHPGDVPDGIRIADAVATIKNYRAPAVWIPYDKCGRSPGGFVWDTDGNFPPFQGQVFCGDQYSSEVFRMSLEVVGGRWQGACYPFRRGLKSGITRVLWGQKGTLWCGLTNRGWGSLGNREHGLQRLVWRDVVPFELAEITASSTGFEVAFTKPISPASALPQSFVVKSWTYDHHKPYGCPPRDVREVAIAGVALMAGGAKVGLDLKDLETHRVYEIRCAGVLSAESQELPVHGVGYYTRNASPE